MQLLNKGMVREHYDVVVVGGGIGGLTSAALLARRGLSVLVLEQHYLPGGCCSAIRRNDVTMDAGSTVLYGFGEKGLNVHRFVMNELGEDIDMIRREAIYRLHVGGKTITFWYDFQRFLDELIGLFPNQEKELRHFFDYAFRVYEKTLLKSEFILPPTEMRPEKMAPMLAAGPEMFELMGWLDKSGLDLFEAFFTDRELIAFFDMLTRTFSYVDAAECPAVLSLTMFCDNHVGGAYYPAGSPQMLPNKLERAIERFGGQVLYRESVDEILIERGRARGVRLDDGTVIKADRVVANTTIWNVYGKLVRPEHIKPARLQWAQGFVPSHSNMILYVQLKRSVLPEGLQPMEVLIANPDDVDGHGITIYLPGLIDPGLSPEDICSVTITFVSPVRWPSPRDPEYRSEAYHQLKQEMADQAIAQVETLIPGFRGAIQGMDIATPSTMQRFTRRNWGTVGGPKQMMGQDMANRPHAQTEWKRLYMTGDSTVMGIGVLPATISAVGVANTILTELGEQIYELQAQPKQHIHIGHGHPLHERIAPEQPIENLQQAVRLAHDCQHCETPACVQACPADIDLVGFLRRVESGNLEGAAASMREMNPLAEICGTACPSERFCESACIHKDIDGQSVQISKLHAWVCGATTGAPVFDEAIAHRPERVAIVGAGPAGLSCAHFLGRLGYQVDLLDRNQRPGGLLSHAVAPSRASEEALRRELGIIDLSSVRFKARTTLGEDVQLDGLRQDYDAVFLAPGLWSGKTLQIPGSDQAWTVDALSMLRGFRDASRGEGPLRVGDRVIVVGGGSVAADAARAAHESGATSVHVVCLEAEAALPMLRSEREELAALGIEIHTRWSPLSLDGTEMHFERCLSVLDGEGRFAPSTDPEEQLVLSFEQVVWAIGQRAESQLSQHLQAQIGSSVPLRCEADSMAVKGQPGLYAGGDIVRGAGTIVEAVGDGRRAATAIDQQLRKQARHGRRLEVLGQASHPPI